MTKNSQPFVKKFQKTAGGIFWLTRTVHVCYSVASVVCLSVRNLLWLNGAS